MNQILIMWLELTCRWRIIHQQQPLFYVHVGRYIWYFIDQVIMKLFGKIFVSISTRCFFNIFSWVLNGILSKNLSSPISPTATASCSTNKRDSVLKSSSFTLSAKKGWNPSANEHKSNLCEIFITSFKFSGLTDGKTIRSTSLFKLFSKILYSNI